MSAKKTQMEKAQAKAILKDGKIPENYDEICALTWPQLLRLLPQWERMSLRAPKSSDDITPDLAHNAIQDAQLRSESWACCAVGETMGFQEHAETVPDGALDDVINARCGNYMENPPYCDAASSAVRDATRELGLGDRPGPDLASMGCAFTSAMKDADWKQAARIYRKIARYVKDHPDFRELALRNYPALIRFWDDAERYDPDAGWLPEYLRADEKDKDDDQ